MATRKHKKRAPSATTATRWRFTDAVADAIADGMTARETRDSPPGNDRIK